MSIVIDVEHGSKAWENDVRIGDVVVQMAPTKVTFVRRAEWKLFLKVNEFRNVMRNFVESYAEIQLIEMKYAKDCEKKDVDSVAILDRFFDAVLERAHEFLNKYLGELCNEPRELGLEARQRLVRTNARQKERELRRKEYHTKLAQDIEAKRERNNE